MSLASGNTMYKCLSAVNTLIMQLHGLSLTTFFVLTIYPLARKIKTVLLQDQNVKMNSVKTDLYGLVGGEGVFSVKGDHSHTVGVGVISVKDGSQHHGGGEGDLGLDEG